MSVFYVGGGKGGSGKSWIAATLMHYFITKGEEPILFETDKRTPDVGKAYSKGGKGKNCKAIKHELKDFDDWQNLIDKIIEIQKDDPEKTIIINSPATTDIGIEDCAGMFNQPEINDMRIIWASGMQQSSAKFLTKFRAVVTEPTICIVKNGKIGKAQNYSFITEEGHDDLPDVFYPMLSEKFTQLIQSRGYAPHEILESADLSIGVKASAEQQLKIMIKIAEEIVTKSAPGYVKENDNSNDFDD